MEECSPWQSCWPHSIWHILCVDTNGTWNDHWMICLFQDFLTSEKIISSHIKITMYNDKKEEINMLSEVIIFIYSHCDTYTKLLKSGHLWPKIYPLWTRTCSKGLTVQHTHSSTRQEEFRVSFHISFHFECTPEIVSPTLLPWMILCDVIIGWQRGLLSISLAFVYCWFVFLINFSLCQRANCVLFVSEGVVGELILILSHL